MYDQNFEIGVLGVLKFKNSMSPCDYLNRTLCQINVHGKIFTFLGTKVCRTHKILFEI
jgi:hypothetical protein